MATELTIVVDRASMDALFARLDRAAAMQTLVPPMTRAVAGIQRDIATYPAPTHYPQPPKSRAQQIKQIMLAKEGKIPYRRTGHLGRSWTTNVQQSATGVTGTVGNKMAYGPLVQGEGTQAIYHQGNWSTDQQVFNRQKDAVMRGFTEAIRDALG
jgi:hypothetical protein